MVWVDDLRRSASEGLWHRLKFRIVVLTSIENDPSTFAVLRFREYHELRHQCQLYRREVLNVVVKLSANDPSDVGVGVLHVYARRTQLLQRQQQRPLPLVVHGWNLALTDEELGVRGRKDFPLDDLQDVETSSELGYDREVKH